MTQKSPCREVQKIKNYSVFLFLFLVLSLVFLTSPARASCPACSSFSAPGRELTLKTPPISGQDVAELQRALKDLGCYNGRTDGVFGPKTKQAVMKFQQQAGLEPDGIVGATTQKAITESMAEVVVKNQTPPPEGKVDILIDTTRCQLHILANGKPYRKYTVAVGKRKTPTPIGNWQVQRKAMNWGTGFGTRWIGLTVPWGIYGIHGTNKPQSIGSYASHGCIRMNNRNVEEIYPWVQKDSRIIIIGNPFTYRSPPFRTMRHNDRGSDVMEVQRLLKRHGFYKGPIDGIWGGGMEEAVIKLRQAKDLRRDNSVDNEVYNVIGM